MADLKNDETDPWFGGMWVYDNATDSPRAATPADMHEMRNQLSALGELKWLLSRILSPRKMNGDQRLKWVRDLRASVEHLLEKPADG